MAPRLELTPRPRGWWQIGVDRQQQRAEMEECGLSSGGYGFRVLNLHSLLSKVQ